MIDKGRIAGWVVALIVGCAILFFISTVHCHAAWTPTDYNTWKQGNEYVTDLGRLPRNYEKQDGSWEIIDTTWQSIGDTLFTCHKANIQVSAWPNGESTLRISLENRTVTIKQTLYGIVFVDTISWNHQNILTNIEFPEPVMSGRDLSWSFPGWRFRIRKDFGAAAHQTQFRPASLDYICSIYDTMPPAARNRVALGTVFKYEVTGIDDSVFLNHPRVTKKRLAKFGKKFLDLTRQVLHFPGYDTLQSIPVRQEWKKIGGAFYLCEYVMMKHIDSVHTLFPDYTVWHAATTIIKGTTLTEDTWITNTNVCENNGGIPNINVKNAGGDIFKGLARCWDVSGQLPANATISACSLIADVAMVTQSGNIEVTRIFKPWVEGDRMGSVPPADDSGATWLQWDGYAFRTTCKGNYWADAGADCYKLNGVDNDYGFGSGMLCEDSTADIYSLGEDIVNITSTGRTPFKISNALAQGWYDGTHAENGVLMTAAANVYIIFTSVEYSWTPNAIDHRGWKFVYTVSEAAAGQVIIVN